MGIILGTINTGRITDLAKQIQFVDDKESLQYIVSSHSKELGNLVSKTASESSKIRSLVKPLLIPPAPTTPSIVRWCQKSIAATAVPQMSAAVKYTQQLTAMGAGLGTIINAVTSIGDKLNSLGINMLDDIGDVGDIARRLQNDTLHEINTSISGALGDIESSQQAINEIIPGYAQLDTTSPEAFNQSVDNNFESMDAMANEFLDQPDSDAEDHGLVPFNKPDKPKQGDLWFDEDTLQLKLYYGSIWIPANTIEV